MRSLSSCIQPTRRSPIRRANDTYTDASARCARAHTAACGKFRARHGDSRTCYSVYARQSVDGRAGRFQYRLVCWRIYVAETAVCGEYLGGLRSRWIASVDGLDCMWWPIAPLFDLSYRVFPSSLPDRYHSAFAGGRQPPLCIRPIHDLILVAIPPFQHPRPSYPRPICSSGVLHAFRHFPLQERPRIPPPCRALLPSLFDPHPSRGVDDVDVRAHESSAECHSFPECVEVLEDGD